MITKPSDSRTFQRHQPNRPQYTASWIECPVPESRPCPKHNTRGTITIELYGGDQRRHVACSAVLLLLLFLLWVVGVELLQRHQAQQHDVPLVHLAVAEERVGAVETVQDAQHAEVLVESETESEFSHNFIM